MRMQPQPETRSLGEAAADREADRFSLPANWREGRIVRAGYAIDDPIVPDRDDLVAYDGNENEGILHVGIADVGTFLRDYPAIRQVALQRGETIYASTRIIRSMISPTLSEDKLCLLPGRERPGLTVHIPIDSKLSFTDVSISREVLRPTALSPYSIGGRISRGEAPDDLRMLYKVARRLLTHRMSKGGYGNMAENEAGGLRRIPVGLSAGSLIVQESMILGNALMAQYARQRELPVPFRRHSFWYKDAASAWYGAEPGPHEGLNLPDGYMHGTSPLRRDMDLVAHCNIAADLDGVPMVYPTPHITEIIREKNTKHADLVKRRVKLYGQQDTVLPAEATLFLERARSRVVGPGEVAAAIFRGARGEPELVQRARDEAVRYAILHPQVGKTIINIAEQQGWLPAEDAAQEAPLEVNVGDNVVSLDSDQRRRRPLGFFEQLVAS